ncbi:TIGR04282 family arsenosugar biosynthesis glycosyltransferase [Polyangium aurulentum]|uniref:TIGR04282 family arsenosugar biosynthesis glycosyltransferase n=1 Tax=Polyangium aurulentum TaxID=2567896 RepID=UPI0010ADACAD|nr:DUF2064 domain-containing protein [Polyangium aurulentum]UQA54821.1 DUF2064 domain-containing protein [Polyangium aurulentum]
MKGRLVPPLSAEQAVELYKALLSDTLYGLGILPMGYRAVLCAPEPDGGAEQLSSIVSSRWQVVPQSASRLEERLASGFEVLLASGAEAAAIVCSDAPFMPLDEVFEGLMWLTRKRRLMLGPTQDGGLYVVGTTQVEPALFEGVDWSSPGVVERARTRAEGLGIEVQVLSTSYDVDEVADLERLGRDVKAAVGPGMGTPACTALLARPEFGAFR